MKQGKATFSPIPSSLGLLLRVLAVVFLAEAVVMVILEAVPLGTHTGLAAIVDAALLVVFSAPFLWWAIFRPLHRAALTEHIRGATVIARAVDGIITINGQGVVEAFNPAAERIFGYGAAEVVGQPVTLLMPTRFHEAYWLRLERVTAGDEPRLLGKTVELVGRRKDGQEFPLELSLARWQSAKDTFFTGIVRDITERKRTEEALAARIRQLEAVRAVTAEIIRQLDLPTLLGLIQRRAAELVGAASGTIYLWDQAAQLLVPKAWHGLGEWMGEVRFRLGEGVAGTVAQRRQGMIANDFRTSPYAVPFVLEQSGITAVLGEPLLYRDRLLGVIVISHQETGRPFTEHDREALALFAAQAAIAIENARLYETSVRQLTELRALYDMGQAITSSLSLDEQLRILVERLGQAAGAQRVLVGLREAGDAEGFRVCLAYDAADADPWRRRLDLSAERYPEIREAVRTGQSLVIPEVAAEPLLAPVREHLAPLDLRSLVVVPLIVRERVIGAVSLGYVGQGRTFTDEELRLLHSFADQAAIAIEKARLYEAIRRHAAELEVRVEERTRELETANQQLQDASRHKSEFLANMSHELRTPLNSIIGFSELLLGQGVGPLIERQARFMGHIHQGGKHLLQLINDILDLSKVEAGKFVLKPEALPVAATLEDILVIARGLANKKGQTVETQIASDLPTLHADPVRFKQILFNLLSNAVKFSPEGETISVRARRAPGIVDFKLQIADFPAAKSEICNLQSAMAAEGSAAREFLEIQVTDTGVGIKAEDLPRLFGEFVQLETTQAQKHEGTGLGLALTKRLVELHGGRIWATSEGEGRGSAFTFVLPFSGPET